MKWVLEGKQSHHVETFKYLSVCSGRSETWREHAFAPIGWCATAQNTPLSENERWKWGERKNKTETVLTRIFYKRLGAVWFLFPFHCAVFFCCCSSDKNSFYFLLENSKRLRIFQSQEKNKTKQTQERSSRGVNRVSFEFFICADDLWRFWFLILRLNVERRGNVKSVLGKFVGKIKPCCWSSYWLWIKIF